MSSGGSRQTTTVQNNDPWSGAVPYINQLLQGASSNLNTGYTPYQGATVAGFSGDQAAAQNLTRNLVNSNQSLNSNAASLANQVVQGTIKNPYAGQNPYLQQMIDASNGDITKAYTNATLPNSLAQFNSGGAFGGSAMQQVLSTNQADLANSIARNTSGLRSEDYNRQAALAQQQIQNQLGAVNTLGQIQQMNFADADALARQGALQQGLQQQAINDDRADWDKVQSQYGNNLSLLAQAIGSINGGSSSSTGANPNYKSAGENAAGYAALIASLYD